MTKTVKQFLKEQIAQAVQGVEFVILAPPDSKLGDYSTNAAFLLAKKLGKKPVEVADELKGKLKIEGTSVEVAPNGFINFFLKPEFLQKKLAEISSDENYGQSDIGGKKKVIVEYSSPNIAKPMHIGHLRSTIIGDALANVYEALGYDVIRWNFIGDWGTAFGKVIAGYKKWGNGKEDFTMQDLLEWYVKANSELGEEEGKSEFKKLEDGDGENKKLWEKIRNTSFKYFGEVYSQLGIDLNKFQMKGESDYEPKLKPTIEELKQKGLTKESEGALIVELDKLPPALLQKSDGATLYITRDIASLEDRITNYHADKILYVVANQQALHFEQLFAIAHKLGWNSAELVHVKFGMVLGEDGKKLATREGKVVPLQEVLDKIIALAGTVVQQKNLALGTEEVIKVARAVGVGALKYNDLKQHPFSDIEFDWKAMLDLSGNSGPYLQYTYARLKNILNKAGDYKAGDLGGLDDPTSRMLMKQLLDFPEAVMECAQLNTLNGLALYLYELAASANKFYETVRVLEDEDSTRRAARLKLVATVARTLKQGLNILGIETLDRI